MSMRFEGQFRVPGRPDHVLERFAQVERMVGCMPGASIDGRDDQGNYLGSMLVAFGPKKIRFRGKVTNAVDAAQSSGYLHVRGAAEMRAGARVEVHARYVVREDPVAMAPTSVVSLTTEAELGGVLADFGRTGGVAVTQALMDAFAERVAEEFGRDAFTPMLPPADRLAATTTDASARMQHTEALSAWGVLRAVMKARLLALAGRLRLVGGRH